MKKLLAILGALASLSTAVCAQTTLINDNFSFVDHEKWQEIRIFLPFSQVLYTSNGLVMSRNDQQPAIKGRLFDTAFELKSLKQSLPKGVTAFDLSVKLGSNKPNFTTQGWGNSYQNRIFWYDAQDKLISGSTFPYRPSFRFPLENPGWSTFRSTIPAGAVKAEVQFGFDSPDFLPGEKAVLANLKFTVGTEQEIAAMPSMGGLPHYPALTSQSPNPDGAASVSFSILNPVSVNWKSFTISLDGTDITSVITRNDGIITYKPATAMAKGLHFFDISITDASGNTEKHVVPYSVRNPRTVNVTTIREDGMPLIDGKPFFMLGIACLVKQGRNGYSYEQAFAEAEAAGMNFARHWSTYNANSKDAQEYLAAAKRHNIFLSMSTTLVKNDTDVRRIAQGVDQQLDVDQILAWDIGDDTASFIDPHGLLAKHAAIHAVDNSRLTTQADGVGGPMNSRELTAQGRYTEYVHASDTFQPEIYPVGHCNPGTETPELTAKMVPTVIHDMMQIKQDWAMAKSGPRPIWPLIQYFYYDPAKSRHWNRMPTAAELRAMSYLAVIHGSHGIFWYRYAGYPNTENATRGYSDEQWKTLSSISLEFRALYDMYCTLPVKQTQTAAVIDGPDKDGLGYDSINTLLKKHDGKTYLIVCNSAMKPVKAALTVPGIKSARDFHEKRTVAVANGTITETFAPYGVHVYVME